MTLVSLEVIPSGKAGWTSGVMHFGRNTTLLLGDNGTGKTPIMRALAFALGQPVQLPQLILEKCSGVRVILTSDGAEYSLERSFSHSDTTTVHEGAGGRTITGDKQLAEFLLPKLGLSLRSFAGKNGQVTPPYTSIAGPMFIVDQDYGWLNWYSAHEAHQFVKDQREEVLRWVMDLPPRNRVVDKTEYESAQVRHGSVQQQIRFTRAALMTVEVALDADRGPEALRQLIARKEALDTEFRLAHSTVRELDHGPDEGDVKTQLIAGALQATSFKLVNLKRRRAQLSEVRTEVGAEIGALEQNEIAAGAFRSFCGNAACQLLRKPEESYGRRVLYLKDQLKDFELNTSAVEREIDILEEQVVAAEGELAAMSNERRERVASSGAAAALDQLRRLSREVTSLQTRIDAIARVEAMRSELEQLLVREQRASEMVADLKPARGPRKEVGRILDARAKLAENFKNWIAILRTPNVSSDVSLDDELRLLLGTEIFGSGSSQSGSTRTRIVLAFHAAVLETSIEINGAHPSLLILDAPRQHELSAGDLRTFIEHFYRMATKIKKNAPQLVFSASDAEVVPSGCIDSLWEPSYRFGDARRFLGPVAARDA
jgi:DNA repair exonuclease SbcCD ATPase subunit